MRRIAEDSGAITEASIIKSQISPQSSFSTSAHAFQLFATNYNGIVSQKNYMFNQNDFFNGDILIGFNITRNYNF